MKALLDHAFSPNAFPISQEVLMMVQKERRGFDFRGEHEDPQIHRKILGIQSAVLSHLLNGWTLDRLTDSSAYGNTYSTNEMISDLTEGIFQADVNTKVNSVRQNLQTMYVRRLIQVIEENPPYQMTSAAVYSALRNIEKTTKKRSQDAETQAHREFLQWLIKKALDD
jgi:hypothetical protein